jgi:hypothetical protein
MDVLWTFWVFCSWMKGAPEGNRPRVEEESDSLLAS